MNHLIHRWSHISIVIVITILLSCNTKPTETPVLETKIGGKVVDKESNNGIAGVQVTTNPTTSSVLTDAAGSYTIPDVKAGQYVVSATKTGYSSNTINVVVTEGKTASADIQLEIVKPGLTVSTSAIDFGTTQTTATLLLSNGTAVGSVNWSISKSVDWLTLSTTSGSLTTGTATVTITASRTNLSFGNYNTVLSITSNGGNKDVQVNMTVPNPNSPQLTVNPLLLDFGSSLSQLSFTVRNSGTGKIDWTASSAQSWITISPNHDSTRVETDQISVIVNRNGLSPGDYTGEIQITSNAGSQIVSIKMNIPSVPVLSVSQSSLDFDSIKSQLTFNVNNAGAGSLSWVASKNQTWMSVNPASGINSGAINVTVDRTSLTPGNYSGTVSLTSNGGNGSVSVQMKVAAPAPPQPVVAQAGAVTTSSIQIQWSVYPNASDFAAYKVYYSTSPAVTENSTLATTITTRTSQSMTISGLSSNTTYYAKVFVVNTNNLSSGSNTVTSTTEAKLGTWSTFTTLPLWSALDVENISDNNVLVAGTGSGSYGRIYQYNGTKWTMMSLPDTSSSITSLSFLSSTEGYALNATGKVFKYNGINWTTMQSFSSYIDTHYEIKAISSSNIWVGGKDAIYHWNGTAWNTFSLDAWHIQSINFVTQSDGYAIDEYGKIFSFNGLGWSVFGSSNSSSAIDDFTRLAAISDSDIWASSSGRLKHYNGTEWTTYKDPITSNELYGTYSIQMINSQNGWIVGKNGIIYFFNGTKWASVTSPVSTNLYKVKMTSVIDGWAVGDGGVVLRYH